MYRFYLCCFTKAPLHFVNELSVVPRIGYYHLYSIELNFTCSELILGILLILQLELVRKSPYALSVHIEQKCLAVSTQRSKNLHIILRYCHVDRFISHLLKLSVFYLFAFAELQRSSFSLKVMTDQGSDELFGNDEAVGG